MTENYATVRHYCDYVRKYQKVNETNRELVQRMMFQDRDSLQAAVEFELDRLDKIEGIKRGCK